MSQKIDVFKFLIFLVHLSITSTSSLGEIRRDLFIIKGDTAVGSGFSVNYNEGFYLCTNQHVVVGQNQIDVENTLGEQIALSDEVLFPDDERDLILIKLLSHKTGFNVTQSINFGEEVISYGNSGGENVITQKIGKILGIGNTEVEYDNPTVSGDSGSAVLNINNQVVAVVTKGLKDQQMNAWLEDRPEMHTRRFGTRINNVSWRKTNLGQLSRISKFYNQVFALNGKWINEYNIYVKRANRELSSFRAINRNGQNYYSRQYVTPIDAKTFEIDFTKSDGLKLPSFVENWHANLRLLDMLMTYDNFWYQDPRSHFTTRSQSIHYNISCEIKYLLSLTKELPNSWFKKSIQDELFYVKKVIDNHFNLPNQELQFNRRDLLFTDNYTTRFGWQLKPEELLFFIANSEINGNNFAIGSSQRIIDYINECRKFQSDVSSKIRSSYLRLKKIKTDEEKLSMRSITFNFDKRKLVFSRDVSYKRKWKISGLQPKLESALDNSINTGNFSFLENFRGRNQGYAHYKTLEGINKRIEALFDDLCENVYDSDNFTEKIGYILNLASQYHSDEELAFYNSLK